MRRLIDRGVPIAVCCLLLSLGSTPVEKSEGLRLTLDLDAFVEAQEPVVVISVVSSHRLFRTNLNLDRFEEYLQTSGSDYVLRISAPGPIRQFTQLMTSLELAESGDADRMDLRYRIDLEDRGEPLFRFYVGAFGEILHEGRAYDLKSENSWLRRAWEILETDVLR